MARIGYASSRQRERDRHAALLTRAAAACAVCVTFAAAGQARPLTPPPTPACLPDRNGDGHPIYSTPIAWLGACQPPYVPTTDCVLALDAEVVDLNGDGHLDLVAPHDNQYVFDGGFTILLGDGDGLLGKADYRLLDASLVGVAAADFDLDGHIDLAFAARDKGEVRVYAGDGSGTSVGFVIKATAKVGTQPKSLLAADFNNDGLPDLLVNNAGGTGDVSILINTSVPGSGSPSFAKEIRIQCIAGGAPYLPGRFNAVGDFDGDGWVDAAIAGSNSVEILLNDAKGTGLLVPVGTLPFPSNLAINQVVSADFNSDGWPDLAAASTANPVVAAWLNAGAPQPVPPKAPGMFPAADSYDVSTEVAKPNTGTTYSMAIAAGDWDGDGDADLAVNFRWASWQVVGLLNDGTGTFGGKDIRTGVHGDENDSTWLLRAADMNADGLDDVLSFMQGNGRSPVYTLLSVPGVPLAGSEHNVAKGTTKYLQQYNMLYLPNDVTLGNIDGVDGPDAVAAISYGGNFPNGYPGGIVIHKASDGKYLGLGEVYKTAGAGTVMWRVHCADLTGDGLDEVVVSAWEEPQGWKLGGQIHVFKNTDGVVSLAQTIEFPGQLPGSIASADFDLDGDQDIVVYSIEVYKAESLPHKRLARVFVNVGSGLLEHAMDLSIDETTQFGLNLGLETRDFDSDGYPDIAALSTYGNAPGVGKLRVLWNNGSLTFAAASLIFTPNKPVHVTSADIDGDDLLDLIVTYNWGGLAPLEANMTIYKQGPVRQFSLAATEPLGRSRPRFDVQAIPHPSGKGTRVLRRDDDANPTVIDVSADFKIKHVASSTSGNVSLNLIRHSDGRMDVVSASSVPGVVSVLRDRSCPKPACRADCDTSGELEIDDFICFQTKYAVGAMGTGGADCDGDGTLTIDDFLCFQAAYALGC